MLGLLANINFQLLYNVIQFKECIGSDLLPHIEDLARLRISVFRDFPYLYDGDMEYEKKYLNTYASSPRSYAVLAMDDDDVIGASTAIPLEDETSEVTAPFIMHNHILSDILYLGESILDKRYRGQGMGKKFFTYREEYGARLNRTAFSFCAVERPEHHPLRPENYQNLNGFWEKMGYQPLQNYSTHFTWQDVDESEESKKNMQFWGKEV